MDKLTVLLLSSSFLRTLFFSKSKSPLLYQVAVFLYHTRQYLARVLTWQVWNEFWLVFVRSEFSQKYILLLTPFIANVLSPNGTQHHLQFKSTQSAWRWHQTLSRNPDLLVETKAKNPLLSVTSTTKRTPITR